MVNPRKIEDLKDNPKFKNHIFLEDENEKRARHLARPHTPCCFGQPVGRETTEKIHTHECLDYETINHASMGKEVEILAFGRIVDGVLVGRMFNKLFIELPDGRVKVIQAQRCRLK